MTDRTNGPAYLFRIDICGQPPLIIAADFMDYDHEDGVTRLYIGAQDGDTMTTPVAHFFPHPSLRVVRIDCLLTMEGLTAS